MRTQQEILQRIRERENDDFFGYERSDLVDYLEYENAKPFLNDTTTKESWGKEPRKSPKDVMIEYMPFAWDKANNFRGLSASRSMSHYISWLWLDGDDELWKTLEDYEFYGKPQLVKICGYLGLDSSKWDDGVRLNSEPEY